MALIKQYVNMPPGTTNVHGRQRRLVARPSDIPAVAPADTVEWWVEPAPGSSNTDIKYLSAPDRGRMLFAQTTFHAPSGRFRNTISLPHVGGDEFVVKCSKRGNRANFFASDTFQTWRKIYYTVFHMGASGLAFFNTIEPRFKAEFARAFVEMENVAKRPTLTEMARVDITRDSSGSAFLKGPPRGVINLKPDGTGAIAHKPFHLVFLIVPDVFVRRNQAFDTGLTRALTGTTIVPRRLHTDPADPQAFVSPATISWTGHPPTNIRNRFATIVSTRAGSSVSWDVTGVAGLTAWLANPAHQFRLRFTIVQQQGLAGLSRANFVAVTTRDGLTDALQTLTHEPAHGMGQVVAFEQHWNAAGVAGATEAHPTHHRDEFGGQGPHCGFNAVLRPPTAGDAGGFDRHGVALTSYYVHGGGGDLCTMFWRTDSHVDPDGKLCPHCSPRLKRADLSSARLIANRHWDTFG